MVKGNAFIGLLSLSIAILYYFLVFQNNLGFSADSMSYLQGAENILDGKGFTKENGELINHWPPLYSLLLAFVSFVIQQDILYGGIILHATLIFFQSFLFYKVLRILKVRQWLCTLGVVIFLFSAPTKVFLWFLSEGLFSVLLIASIYALLKWTKDRSKFSLYFAGILTGLLMLTRHAGLSFTMAFSLFILLMSRGSLPKKSFDLGRFLLPAVLIFFPWFFYAKHGDSQVISHFTSIFFNWKKMEMGKNVIKYWFVGNYISAKVAPWVITLFIFQILLASRKIRSLFFNFLRQNRPVLFLCFISLTTYLLFLLFANFYYNDQIPFDNRMLFPVFPFLTLAVILVIEFGLDSELKLSSLFLSAFLLMSFLVSAFPVYLDFHLNGLGYTKEKWKTSSLIRHISREKNFIYYSNAPEIVKLHTNKTSRIFPNNSKKVELEDIKAKVKGGTAQLLIMKSFSWPEYMVREEDIKQEFRDFECVHFDDGIIVRSYSKDL